MAHEPKPIRMWCDECGTLYPEGSAWAWGRMDHERRIDETAIAQHLIHMPQCHPNDRMPGVRVLWNDLPGVQSQSPINVQVTFAKPEDRN